MIQDYSNSKSFVNFLLPPLSKGRVGVGLKIYDSFRIAIASSPWQHFDQTGARVGGLNYTTNVICHPLYTVYFILNPLTSSLLQKFQIPAKCQNALKLLPQETVLSQAHFNDLLNNYLAKLGSQQLARIREVATIALYHQQTDCPLVQTLCCDYAPIQVNHC